MAKSSPQAATEFLSFVNASPTPFHAVHSAKTLLEEAGFKQIKERDPWSSSLKPGQSYYLTRNGTSIIAFTIGGKWKPGNPIAMIGAHTDSCCLRIKPISKKQSDGFLQIGVETYGGGLWHTWFDRDLSIAGRAMVKSQDGSFVQKLIKIKRPILRIPSLAIHLDRQVPFEFNNETQLLPIAGLVAAELNRQGKSAMVENKAETDDEIEATAGTFEPLKVLNTRHHPCVVEVIAKEAGVDPSAVVDFEMLLYDTQEACIGGINNEFIFSARLDNLMMSFCAIKGLVQSVTSSSALKEDTTIRLTGLFDHEEIGSLSAQGADSNLLPAVIRRLSVLPAMETSVSDDSYDKLTEESTAFEQTLATSFLVSADMAHSVHPNYSAKHDSEHRPEMNKGTVLKINSDVRYATNSPGIVLLQECARRAKSGTGANSSELGVPLQLFVTRNDARCGSTIGPMLSAALGARTLDLGNAQLSMHSIRETAGVHDVELSINLFESFFNHFGELEKMIIVD